MNFLYQKLNYIVRSKSQYIHQTYHKLFWYGINGVYVVIKVVLKSKSGSLQREKSIFEFLKSRDVKCPNIASYLRGFQTEHYECAVLEYYEGGDLFSKMEGGDLSREETRRYALQILTSIEALHANGIIMKDLKPENIVISNDSQQIKLIDFGISQYSFERIDQNQGTPAYMSPELYQTPDFYFTDGTERLPHAVDYWAFGCILYEMISGRKAFEGSSLKEIKSKVLDSQPLRLQDRLANDLIFNYLLIKNPCYRVCKAEVIRAHAFFTQ